MKNLFCIRTLFILSGIWVIMAAGSCSLKEQADLVILNGKVITVDNEFTITEALAVQEDRIVAVGTGKVSKEVGGQTNGGY